LEFNSNLDLRGGESATGFRNYDGAAAFVETANHWGGERKRLLLESRKRGETRAFCKTKGLRFLPLKGKCLTRQPVCVKDGARTK